MAIQPAPSEWSATFSFQTQQVQEQQPSQQSVIPETQTPLWVWVVMVTGVFMILTVIILIIKELVKERNG